jgi:hypothetical protein
MKSDTGRTWYFRCLGYLYLIRPEDMMLSFSTRYVFPKGDV